jgi:cytochrome P450
MLARFTEWSQQYGGLFSLKLGPANAVVITDRHVAKQLLDKRSVISSDRPVNMVSQQLITGGDHLLWMQATPAWKQMRKLIHQDVTETMCNKQHARLQHAESVQMLKDMIEAPDAWKRHLSRFSNSIILSIGKLSTGLNRQDH